MADMMCHNGTWVIIIVMMLLFQICYWYVLLHREKPFRHSHARTAMSEWFLSMKYNCNKNVNSLAPWRCSSYFNVPDEFYYGDISTLVRIMAWYRQTTRLYLSQCGARSMSLYYVTRSQWVMLSMATIWLFSASEAAGRIWKILNADP